MNIIEIGSLSFSSVQLNKAWLVDFNQDPICYLIKPSGDFEKLFRIVGHDFAFKNEKEEFVYIDDESNLTYDINKKIKCNVEIYNLYSYNIVEPGTIYSEFIGCAKDEMAVLFKNNNTKQIRSILIPSEIITLGVDDSDGFPISIRFSKDQQTILIYQTEGSNGKVLIMDNPVFE